MYDLVAAVKEIDRAIAFSYARSHPTALAKLLELKAKLYGLVTEKHEVITVDLTKALNDAQARVLRRDLHQPIALNNGEDGAREY